MRFNRSFDSCLTSPEGDPEPPCLGLISQAAFTNALPLSIEVYGGFLLICLLIG